MSALISANLLASLTALDESAMPERCTLQRLTPTDDGRGGQHSTPTVLATGVPCRVTASGTEQSARIVSVADQLAAEAPWLVEVPLELRDADGNLVVDDNGAPVAVQAGDQLAVGATIYEVIRAFPGQSFATSLPIGCKVI